MLFNYASEYAIGKFHKNQMGFNVTHQLLLYAEDVNLLGAFAAAVRSLSKSDKCLKAICGHLEKSIIPRIPQKLQVRYNEDCHVPVCNFGRARHLHRTVPCSVPDIIVTEFPVNSQMETSSCRRTTSYSHGDYTRTLLFTLSF
ncbi:uncharacterized protein LOC111871493 [Cryptotermes secundus]|uniref:uncharacterized protein LOC111871493 n=1 Tax=Cryptotermes secundus TaxID=105785 RepID=UPI000CD7B5AA|nr:uncharacterized protein LOC111871493 [Cryptotermes secundus]